MTVLHPRLVQQMNELHDDLSSKGALPSVEALQSYYATFRQRFGPDVLKALSGEPLLELVKGNGRDGLVYWLEFKGDDEFPAHFGSIAGGSSLKYVVYRRRETGAWTTGSPQAQREIPAAEALSIATAHRDQLIAASEVLDALQPSGDDAYARLQA
jgi:5-methylcytosine-specific restriction protein B